MPAWGSTPGKGFLHRWPLPSIIRAEAAPFQIIVENKDPTILWANVDGAEGRRIDLSNQPTEHAWIAISCIVLCTHHGNSRLLNDRWEAGTHTE